MRTAKGKLETYLDQVTRTVRSPLTDRVMSVLDGYLTLQNRDESKRHALDAILAIDPEDARRIVDEPHFMQAIELRMRTPETQLLSQDFGHLEYRWGGKAGEAVKVLAYAFSTCAVSPEERSSFLEKLVTYNDSSNPLHSQGIQLENDGGYWVNYFTDTLLDEGARDPEESERVWDKIREEHGRGETPDFAEAYSLYPEPYYVCAVEHIGAFEQHEERMSTFFHTIPFLHYLAKDDGEAPEDAQYRAAWLNTMIHLWSNAVGVLLPSDSRGIRHYRKKRSRMFEYFDLEETPFPDRFHRTK